MPLTLTILTVKQEQYTTWVRESGVKQPRPCG